MFSYSCHKLRVINLVSRLFWRRVVLPVVCNYSMSLMRSLLMRRQRRTQVLLESVSIGLPFCRSFSFSFSKPRN